MSNSATLCAHAGSELITRENLALIQTPAATKTWKPVAHCEIVDLVEKAAIARRLLVKPEDTKISVTPGGNKMFGVMKIGLEIDSEFGFAVGFRNSHNKTMALRLAFGTNVFVCDNMALRGDFQCRSVHHGGLECSELIEEGMDFFGDRMKQMADDFGKMREIEMAPERGFRFLSAAAKIGALHPQTYLDATTDYIHALDGNPDAKIAHPRTLWGPYQAITATWRGGSPFLLEEKTMALDELARAAMAKWN